jgi:hypothetical protein
MSRSWLRPLGTFDLVFWTVVMCLALVAVVVHAFRDRDGDGDGDGEKLFYACVLFLTRSRAPGIE